MRTFIWMLFLILSCGFLPARAADTPPAGSKSMAQLPAERPKKSVLCLNSYHHGYKWSDAIMEGMRSVLDASRYKIDLQIEYMDSKRYSGPEMTDMLLRLYTEKFRNERFDIILASDNDAYTFLTKYRDVLFPGVPAVFCGVNLLGTDDPTHDNMTGVVERFDLSKTLDVALRMHPGKRHMVVVGDSSTAGRAIRRQIKDQVVHYSEKLDVDYWVDLSLSTVQQRVQNLPADTFLFFVPYYQSINGRYLTAEEVMAAIYRQSAVPIYTAWKFLLGHGAVGGYMISGFLHGQTAARLALQVLDGTPVDDLPIRKAVTGDYYFDYQVMKRLMLDLDLLPKGSQIINAPKASYQLPKELFWTIIISFVLLIVVLIFLVLTMIERRKVERKIKDQLAFQEALMDTVPQLVSWKNSNGHYLGVNRAFAEFFGLDKGQAVVGRTSKELMRDKEYVTWAVKADRAVLDERAAFRKVRRKLKDAQGNPAWIEVNKVPIVDRSDEIIGVLSTAENVTHERNLEKQLLQSQKMEAIGTLAGGIAHDFNNILTSIINSTELAVSDVDQDSVTGKDLQRVLKAARRGGRVVKQILTFSRPSTEGFRATELGGIISEVHGLMESSMPRNIVIRSSISPESTCVMTDPTQIHQVIMNLCTNAFHALRATGGVIEIRLSPVTLDDEQADIVGLPAGPYVRIDVLDNGPGIPREIRDKIFDPFFSTKDKTEGTGLGLAVVHGIVRSHRGSVRVSDREGGGTVFSIFLPRCAPPEADTQSVLQNNEAMGIHVLFVEDDQDQLLTTPRLLEAMGCRVTARQAPEAALELLQQDAGAFDMVVTDYDMPGISGTQLAAELQRIRPETPVILISGREDAMGAAAGLPNIRMVIIKPYDKHDLSRAIHTVLEAKRQGE